jgi:DnaK suppressor protein
LQQRLEARRVELMTLIDVGRRADAPVSPDKAIGRLTRQDALQQQQMAAELMRRNEQELVRVENALRAMGKGTYGICQRCEEPIAPARLTAMLYAALCVRCAELPSGHQ